MKTPEQVKQEYLAGRYELSRMNGHIFDHEVAERHFDEFMEGMRHVHWDQGFTAGMRQWQKQREDPTHPITRTNPYTGGRG